MMSYSRYISALFFAGLLLFPIGCSQKPTIPEIFKAQLLKFLEEGTKTNAKAEQGVSYSELREQVASTKAAYDLLKSTWPASLPTEMQKDFDRGIHAWELTVHLWNLKVGKKDNPTEPDINGWNNYLTEFEDHLVIRTYDSSYIVEDYRGKRYLPFDENISALLTVAGVSFNTGRTKILEKLK
jgi:hypothetical protein